MVSGVEVMPRVDHSVKTGGSAAESRRTIPSLEPDILCSISHTLPAESRCKPTSSWQPAGHVNSVIWFVAGSSLKTLLYVANQALPPPSTHILPEPNG